MVFLAFALTAALAYLLGSIPTGYLTGRARGVDLRTAGSGNIGATNAFRVLGKPAGCIVLLVDAAKGYVAAELLPSLVQWVLGPAAGLATDRLAVVAGIASILGHNYTCWLRFKGGKGIATTAGVLLALIPGALGICLGVWGVVFLVGRYVSLASIAAALALPVAVWWLESGRLLVFMAAALGTLAIYKHKANIRRLLNGTEHRFGRPHAAASSSSSP